MPITEVVRVLATAVARDGRTVALCYDVDGRMGSDEDAVGFPRFWLGIGSTSHGPFDSEGEALDEAERRFGACF